MPTRDGFLPPDTSHNKDSGRRTKADDNVIDKRRDVDNQTESAADWQKIGMSPAYTYSAEEAGVILGRSPITIRLEARTIHAGIRRPNGWIFNSEDIDRMKSSFLAKKGARRRGISDDNPTLTASILQRQEYQGRELHHMQVSLQSWAHTVGELTGRLMGRFEEVEERIRKLERGGKHEKGSRADGAVIEGPGQSQGQGPESEEVPE